MAVVIGYWATAAFGIRTRGSEECVFVGNLLYVSTRQADLTAANASRRTIRGRHSSECIHAPILCVNSWLYNEWFYVGGQSRPLAEPDCENMC
jgi:hypothetical protein